MVGATRSVGIARQIARIVHRDQLDKAGRPYFDHVERVDLAAGREPSTDQHRHVALWDLS